MTALLRGYRAADAPHFEAVTGSRELVQEWAYAPTLEHRGGVGAHRLDERHAILLVAPATGYVLLHQVDWTDRRAEVSVGVRPGARRRLAELLAAGVRAAFEDLDLRRVAGTTVDDRFGEQLTGAGFAVEGVVPGAAWHGGRPADVTYWGRVRGDGRSTEH